MLRKPFGIALKWRGVGEHPVVVIFEIEAYPEHKILSSEEFQELLKTHSCRDLAKSRSNKLKHGIDFSEAQEL